MYAHISKFALHFVQVTRSHKTKCHHSVKNWKDAFQWPFSHHSVDWMAGTFQWPISHHLVSFSPNPSPLTNSLFFFSLYNWSYMHYFLIYLIVDPRDNVWMKHSDKILKTMVNMFWDFHIPAYTITAGWPCTCALIPLRHMCDFSTSSFQCLRFNENSETNNYLSCFYKRFQKIIFWSPTKNNLTHQYKLKLLYM